MACEDIDVHFDEEQTEIIEMSETKVKYFNRQYQKVASKMYDYNCDVKLIVGSETFKAHRAVLEQASDYFSAMFTHDMAERSERVVELKAISSVGFAAMIDYFYHGYIAVDTPTIAGVIEAARFFHIDWLIGVCRHYLVHHLSLEDLDLVTELADEFVLGDLRRRVFEYFRNSFPHMSSRPRSLRLSWEAVATLLGEDRCLEASEGVVLRWALRWLAHDPPSRERHRSSLLSMIRFPLLSAAELDSLGDDVTGIAEVSAAIVEARDYRATPGAQCLMGCRGAEPRGTKEFIVVYSGVEDEGFAHYKPVTASASIRASLVGDLNPPSSGSDASSDSPAGANGAAGFLIERFDTSGLGIVFEFASAATLGNFLFVTGGYGRERWCSSELAYRYDPRDGGVWTQIASMSHPRVSHALVAAPRRGLYAIAGIDHIVIDGMDRELILNAVEFFDPSSPDRWNQAAPIPVGCYNVGAAEAGGRLYVTGGISADPEHSVPVDLCWEYDAAADVWSALPAMNVARHSHAVAALERRLVAVGGCVAKEDDTMGFVDCHRSEAYDIETRQWTLLAAETALAGHIQGLLVAAGRRVFVLGGHSREECCLHEVDVTRVGEVGDGGGEVGEGELVGAYAHKIVSLRVAMPEQYLDELEAVNCAG